jgi:integral membrane protein
MHFRTALGRLRLIGFAEGISWVLLLGAMAYRYFTGVHTGVRITGSIHGGLFLLYFGAVVNAWVVRKWPIVRGVVAGLVSLPPFATFVFDRSLKREQEEAERKPTPEPVVAHTD